MSKLTEMTFNPLNLRVPKKPFKGQKGEYKGYCVFIDWYYGYRAAARIIRRTYYGKHKLDTVGGIISRWAPPTEHDTRKYIAVVCRKLEVGKDERLKLNRPDVLASLLWAMGIVESGGKHTRAEIKRYVDDMVVLNEL